MATINLNITNKDIVNINVTDATDQTEVDALHDKLRKQLVQKSNNAEHHFWYEVFSDFSEVFDDVIYPLIKNLPYEAAFDLCWGYLQRRDDYYRSPKYCDDLNEMLQNKPL